MVSNIVLSTKGYKVVGKRPIRHDGYDKVTGKALYGADIYPPGLLHGKMLRSPHAHARIVSIDTSRAEAHPDIRAVVTGKDLPESEENGRHASHNILARETVLYKGHAIAAVAASNAHVAGEALSLIDVEYEVLPSATTVEDAMKPGAPRLHVEYEGNVARRNQLKLGDVDKGFEEADIVVEREYRTPTVHQGYIEPHSATASWGSDGKLTIWCSSQGHFQIGEATAGILGIAASSIKVGVTREGRLTAVQASLMYEAGAFPGSPVGAAALCMFAPYNAENLLIDTYDVVDNKPRTAAYRAPGAPIGSFASETVIDEICEKLSMDPLEFRVLNGAKEGTRRANGMANPRIGCIETAEAAQAHQHYSEPLEGLNRGRGVASGFWTNGAGPACATANVNFDGTVNLIIRSVDIGGTRPAAAQQFAEVLGIPAEDVNPQVGDTESIGYTSMTGGSSVAFKTGWACYEAGQDVRRQMLERVARLWEVSDDSVELVDGVFKHKTDPELQMTFQEMAGMLPQTGGPVVGRANLSPKGSGSTFATAIIDVEVDPETGKVTILRCTIAQDAGKAVHPSYVEGQMQGGMVQGIGWALNEEYYMSEDGHMLNSSFLDYRMPISLDLPMIDTVIVEVANPGHPYGVRGVAEVPIVPPLAAVANAIHDAIGVRMTRLPMNPPSIVEALAKNGGE